MKFLFSIRLFSTLIAIHLLCQVGNAQQISLFQKVAPALFDSVKYNPDAFAIGDVNGDNYEDLIISQSGRKPIIFYFGKYETPNKSLGYWDFRTVQGDTTIIENYNSIARDTVPLVLSNFGPLQIANTDGLLNNEFFFHFNTYDVSAKGFRYDENQPINKRIVTFPLPAGYGNSFRSSLAWTFSDFNRDGLLDAIQGLNGTKTANNFYHNNVYKQNNQPYSYSVNTDVSTSFGRTVGLYAFDFDKDGWVDLLEINTDYPGLTNLQDFYYQGTETGIKKFTKDPKDTSKYTSLSNYTNSLGAAIGDYNNDGLLDVYQLFSGGARANRLYKNVGNHLFERVENNTTRDQLDSRSGMWGDFNNDGFLDLVIAEYNGAGGNGAYPTLFQNNGPDATGNYTFSKRVISSLPELNAIGNWLHVAFVDEDLDGDLDILLLGKQNFQPVQIFRNNLIQSDSLSANTKKWIGFDLETRNTFTKTAINAKLTLTATINGKVVQQFRELQPFHGFLAQQTKLIHFGLFDANSARLDIIWPSGTSQRINFNSSDLNKYQKILEPEASKLVIRSAQPFVLNTNLEELKRDTVRFENIGSGNLTINSVSIKRPYYKVASFSAQTPAKQMGFIALEIQTSNSSYLGSFSDTLFISSNNLTGTSKVIINTKINSRPARFTQMQFENQASGLNDFDTYTYSWLADFNNDNKIDLLVNRKDSSLSLYLNSQENGFTPSTQIDLAKNGVYTRSIALGDVNNDGKTDIFIANDSRPSKLLLSTSNGFVEKPINAISTAKNSKHTLMYDLDGNGFLDIIIANNSNQANQIVMNYEGVYFDVISSADDEFTRTLGFTNFIKVHDIDKDGLADILAAELNNPNGNKIYFYKQTSPLVFKKIALKGVTDITFTAKGIHIFDKDNDGDDDILLVSGLSSTSSILLENQAGTYASVNEAIFTTIRGIPGDVALFDFNMDGYIDLFFTDEQFEGKNTLLQSTGGTNFLLINSGALVSSQGKSTLGAALFDFNSDAKPDLMLSNYFGSLEIFQNDLAENNWIGITPFARYESDTKSLRPGTRVELKVDLYGKEQIMSRTLGYQSLFSGSLQAVWFGLGTATSATYSIKIPGIELPLEGTISEVNTYLNVDELLVNVESQTQIPQKFSVTNAYPNPFNPSTQIQVEIPRAGLVQFVIYDVLGRKVQQFSKTLSPGKSTQQFELSALSSGIYILQTTFESKVFTQKILLLK